MKEEIVNICRVKRDSGKDGFRLPPYKDASTGASESTLHDDRAYCLALAGLYLQERRLEHIRQKKREQPKNLLDSFKIRAPQGHESIFS